jgi:hypothetical protein
MCGDYREEVPGVYKEVVGTPKVLAQFSFVWKGNPSGTANYIDRGRVQGHPITHRRF